MAVDLKGRSFKMIKVTLKNDVVKEFDNALSAFDVAKEIGAGLAKSACAARIDGKVCDLRTTIDKDCTLDILTFDDEDGKKAYRHTTSHIMAQAVKRIFPNAKIAIGPAIENGFYYDFQVETAFTPADLEKIEAEIKKIIKENIPLERIEATPDEARKMFADEPFKLELIEEHAGKGENISCYKQGDFTDLCAGPHLMSTGCIKAVKLTQCTGCYWRGDATKATLSRIYGTSFPKASLLEAYLTQVEEAKKRDHNKLGRDLELFTTVDYIGQGLPIMLPKGAKIMQTLIRFVEDEEERRGYVRTKTPFMAKSDLYKISGHWDHYKDGMFILGDEEKDKEVFALRPMTCPFQYQVFLNRKRSYRELPMRLGETSTLFRNEDSGEMHGLIRVRQFTISEGHLILRPEQLEEEFKGCLDLANFMLKTLGLDGDVSYRFSQWDPNNTAKYIGTAEQWDEAQGVMEKILNHLGVKYTIGIDEAAFYGPKLDIQIKNVHGKEDTLVTIQIDQMLAELFGMEYVDVDGKKRRPYIIHRTSIGCYERTLALLIEKYAGAFPLWLAPTQVKIMPIADRHNEYCDVIYKELRDMGISVEVDDRSEKIGFKIREAQLEKVPYMLVIGDKEVEAQNVSPRCRKRGDMGTMARADFYAMLKKEIDEKTIL